MKLYTVEVFNLRQYMKEDNPSRNYFKGDNFKTRKLVVYTDPILDVDFRLTFLQPLFIYLPFQAVHGPLQVPKQYKDPYKNITSKHRQTYAGT